MTVYCVHIGVYTCVREAISSLTEFFLTNSFCDSLSKFLINNIIIFFRFLFEKKIASKSTHFSFKKNLKIILIGFYIFLNTGKNFIL